MALDAHPATQIGPEDLGRRDETRPRARSRAHDVPEPAMLSSSGKWIAVSLFSDHHHSRLVRRERVRRYHDRGVPGLADRPRPGKPAEVPGSVRARILALTRMTPPAVTGLTHWSSREMAAFLARHENVRVSHNFIADLWRAHDLRPHRSGTFKLSNDPAFVDRRSPTGRSISRSRSRSRAPETS
ncbi:hypothetical protein GCM10022225_77940 [Plantactinospora mayteni]